MKVTGTIVRAALLAVVLPGLSACAAPTAQKLDLTEYLKHADEKLIYPTAEQIEMLRPFVPKTAYRPAPPISDRAFWEKIETKEAAQKYFEMAVKDLNTKPEVPISDEIYRRANKEGNRGIYKPRYYRTMERLEKAVIAECMENEGRFIPTIVEHINAIMEMKSWLHPNHDDNENSVLEGKRVAIDLGARKFGSVLMLAEVLLEDKLPAELRTEIKKQIQWRMIDSYLKSSRGEDMKGNSWIYGHSNWNAVCTGGTLFSTLTASDDLDERLAVLGSALNSMERYLHGFGEDGYCSEGIGYWNYGFGNYLYLAQMVYDYTDGKVDLFTFTNPEKMKRVGNFPANFQIQQGVYPCFADGGASVGQGSDNFAYLLSAKNYGARKPSYSRPEGMTMQIMEWADPVSYVAEKKEPLVLPPYSYYEDYGIVISRGQQAVPFSIAIKAGHNGENHNHSDVGSYVLVLGDDHNLSGDLGAPPYQAGSFSPNNKVRCSWGHPLPFVDETMQSNGKEFCGKVLETEFTENSDNVVIDIRAAYEVDKLDSLVRTMQNDKSGKGTISVTDTFAASKSIKFGTAILTYADYEIVDSSTILLMNKGKKIKVNVSTQGGSFKFTEDAMPEKYLRYADKATRIGIDFKDKRKSGSITVVYTPVD
jgi:hypothetical protein